MPKAMARLLACLTAVAARHQLCGLQLLSNVKALAHHGTCSLLLEVRCLTARAINCMQRSSLQRSTKQAGHGDAAPQGFPAAVQCQGTCLHSTCTLLLEVRCLMPSKTRVCSWSRSPAEPAAGGVASVSSTSDGLTSSTRNLLAVTCRSLPAWLTYALKPLASS